MGWMEAIGDANENAVYHGVTCCAISGSQQQASNVRAEHTNRSLHGSPEELCQMSLAQHRWSPWSIVFCLHLQMKMDGITATWINLR